MLLPPVAGCHPPPPDLGEVFRPQAPVSGEPMTLKGLLSQFYPKQLAMTWLQKRERRKEPRPLESSPPPQHRTHTPSRVPDRKSYSVDSELSLPTVGTEDGVTDYQCHVEHEALKKPKSSRKLRLKGRSLQSRKCRPGPGWWHAGAVVLCPGVLPCLSRCPLGLSFLPLVLRCKG